MTKQRKRDFQLLDVRARTEGEYHVSLASAYPVNRGGYVEVMDLSPSAIDLSRATDGLPLLSDHSRTRLGRINNLRSDGEKLRGILKFFDTQAGREARAEVEGGHRELSVGYEVLNTRDDGRTVHVTRWRPYEGSLVAVAADPTVGINRSIHQGTNFMNTEDNGAGGADDLGDNMTRAQRRAAGQQAQQERERVDSIRALARPSAYGDYLSASDVGDAIANGTTVLEMQRLLMERMTTGATDTTTIAGRAPAFIRNHGDPQDITGRYSLARAILSQVDPAAYARQAGFEAEQGRELQRRSGGLDTAGLLVPIDVMFPAAQQRDFSVGTASQAGNLVQTTVMPNLIAALRARSVVAQLGATMLAGLTGPINIPKQTAVSAVGWNTETGDFTETEPTTGVVSLVPRRIGAYVEPSRQAVITSQIDVLNMLAEDLRNSILAELDRVALLGTAASNQPRGIQFTSGIGSVVGGTNGATLTWAHILELESAVDGQNGVSELRTTGYVINTATRSFLKRTPRSATLSLGMVMGDQPNDEKGFNMLNGYRAGVTSKIPSNLVKGTSSDCSLVVFGDFSQLIVAQFGGGIELIVDPYTLAKSSQVRITANLFADIGVRQAASFATMADARLV
jgi:HK97 family phage major capsid protein